MKRRLLALLLATLMLLPSLFSCGDTPAETKGPEESGTPEDSLPESESDSESESEAEEPVEPLTLIKDKKYLCTFVASSLDGDASRDMTYSQLYKVMI